MSPSRIDDERRRDQETRKRVVASTGCSTIVEAAAGTGKTTLLVDRILHGVRTGALRLADIVAITFTEKAAAELESRLRYKLTVCLRDPQLTPAERQHVEAAVTEIDRAHISTIHSFCAALLRERPVEAGVDPEFEVLDQTRADLLKEECWRAWLAQQVQRSDGPLVDALLAGVEVSARGLRRTTIKALADAVIESPEVLDRSLFDLARPTETLDELAREIQALAGLLQPSLPENPGRGNSDSRALRSCTQKLLRADAGNARALLAAALPLAALDQAKALRGVALQSAEQAGELLARLVAATQKGLSRLACELFDWVGEFASFYREQKRRRSALDFQDLLLLSARMLRHDKWVRSCLGARFRMFFVDEFQDTDPLQAEVIAFLCEKPDGPPAESLEDVILEDGKLFVVGDPKQSIYRFRRADVKVYEQFKRLFLRLGEDAVCQVSLNYRSSPALIASLNALFERILTPPDQEGVYQARHVPLLPPGDAETMPARVIAVYPPAGVLQQGMNAEAVRQLEGRYLARVIRQMVEGRLPAGLSPLASEGPLRYGSFALLFRALTDISIYEEALEQCRIPYRVFGGKSYYQSEEIAETLAVLRAVDDPLDQISIVAALRSSYFGLSDEELFHYREHGGKWNYLPADVRTGPVGTAMTMLAQWHERCNAGPPQVLLREILDRTKALEAFMLKPAGQQRAANVQKLLGQLRSLWDASRSTFRSIIDYLAELKEREEAEEESSIVEPGDDFVLLLSIHKAKGLQFDAVVLPDLSRHFPKDIPALLIDRQAHRIAVGLEKRICSGAYRELAALETANQLAEQRRALYVAATRARRLLFLPLYWQKEGNGANCMLEFITSTGLLPEPEKVLFGEQRDGVFYWDTTAWKDEVSISSEPRSAPATDQTATVEKMLAEREQWMEEHRSVAQHASSGLRIVLPSMLEEQAQGAPRAEDLLPGTAGREFGVLFHEVMKGLPLTASLSPAEIERLAGGLAHMAAAAMGLQDDAAQEAACLAARTWASPDLRDLVRSAEAVEQEVPFVVPLSRLPVPSGEEGILEGSVDLLLTGPGGTVVLDYKTDRVTPQSVETVAERYWPQLALYGLAAQACGQARGRTELALFFVRADRLCRKVLDQRLVAQIEPRLRAAFLAAGCGPWPDVACGEPFRPQLRVDKAWQ